MLLNGKVTVYQRKLSGRSFVWGKATYEAWRHFTTGIETTENEKEADSIVVRIPSVSVGIKKGDMIVDGVRREATPEEVKRNGVKVFRAVKVIVNDYGANQHTRIEGV